MRRRAAAAALLAISAAVGAAAAEGESQAPGAQAGAEQLTASAAAPGAVFREPRDEPLIATTTTTTAPPTTTTAAPETTTTRPPPPPTTAPPPPPQPAAPAGGGRCGGWEGLIAAYFPDEVGTACRVMMCESGGDPTIHNRTSSASGLWQFLDSTWERTTGTPAPAANYSAEAQTAAAAKLRNSSGWSQWSCY